MYYRENSAIFPVIHRRFAAGVRAALRKKISSVVRFLTNPVYYCYAAVYAFAKYDKNVRKNAEEALENIANIVYIHFRLSVFPSDGLVVKIKI